jgi:hypothetical protein
MASCLTGPGRHSLLLTASLLAIGAASCHRSRAASSTGIAVRATVRPATVAAGSPFAVEYSWSLEAGGAPPPEGFGAFVHFVYPGGAIAFTDDHVPEPPPFAWRPGETHRYERTLFAPEDAFADKLQVRVGLFDPQRGRLLLAGADVGLQEYVAAEVELARTDSRRRLRYGSGWYAPEAPPDDPFGNRRWIRPEAWLAFRNHQEDVIALLRAETSYAAFARPPVLTLAIGPVAAAVPITSSAPFTAAVRFPAVALGKDRWTELKLAMSGSFVPSALGMNQDQRELGLWVHHVFVGPASEVAPLLTSAPISAAMAPGPPGRPAH